MPVVIESMCLTYYAGAASSTMSDSGHLRSGCPPTIERAGSAKKRVGFGHSASPSPAALRNDTCGRLGATPVLYHSRSVFCPPAMITPAGMIAAYAIPEEREPGIISEPRNVAAVHITRLLPDGSNRERGDRAKITIASPLGRPIVLAPPNDRLGMMIAEGIEDALSAYEGTGLGAWAAGSASFMPALAEAIPHYIESLTVLVDDNPAGWRGSTALRDQLIARRRTLEIRLIKSAPDGLRFE
jgi:hypothetical protein